MNDLDQMFLDASNRMTVAWNQMSNAPYEMISRAEQIHKKELAEFNKEILLAKIESAITTIIIIGIIIFLYKWFYNTEAHLKKISGVAQQLQQKANAPNEPNAEQKSLNNQATTPHHQSKPNHQKPPVMTKEQAALDDFSSHPDSRYMPKS